MFPLEVAVSAYVVINLVTFCLYVRDKRASKRAGARRTSEITLHLWAFAGGFAGALLGQMWLRHKTRHASFAVLTTLALAVHAGAWAWWLTR
ncbi:MAG TPA: DUF1294 domain-containing protein [Rariglobus sp.]|jgi:uncharacterized membrane protein YsdA (DUF1294 family)|nr:DUF1294 domain-containing protein [Rariglobus sp.]